MKYLTLIRSIALLHQFQRGVKTLYEGERTMRYIEVEPKDIELANKLAQEVLGRTVDELQPQTRKLLVLIHDWIETECRRLNLPQADFRFTRRQVREALQWGDTQLKVHLGRLTELEYLVAHSGKQGRSYAYELLYQGEDAEGRAKLLGLIDCTRLQGMTTTSRGPAVNGRGLVGGQSVGSRAVVMPMESSTDGHLPGFPEFETGNAHQGVIEPAQSKLSEVVR